MAAGAGGDRARAARSCSAQAGRDRAAAEHIEKDEIGAINYRIEQAAWLAQASRSGPRRCEHASTRRREQEELAAALMAERRAPTRRHLPRGGRRRRRSCARSTSTAPTPPTSSAGRQRLGIYLGRLWDVRGRRPARVEHRGRHLPGHLRHRDDGLHHEHHRGAARRAGGALPARVRQAGPDRAHWCASRSTTWPACPRSCSACSASASSSTSWAAPSTALFFAEALPTPTYGTGGILWASLTLALLTVPVVIVASEEALAAVPRSMREASLAMGATKFQTILRVVLPAAAPGHPDRPDPGHGARRRRGGAADADRRRQAGARAAARRLLPVLPPRPQVHAPGLPHLRRGLPEPERGGGQADGLHHHHLPAHDRGRCST